MAKRKPVQSPENKAIDPAPENKSGTGRREGGETATGAAPSPFDGHPHAPVFWRYETTGLVAPAVRRYLAGEHLLPGEIAVLQDYCRQWIMSPLWDMNPHGNGRWLPDLRRDVERITSMMALKRWLATAEAAGCDPL